ncbi:MAG: TrpR YerC/YecD [Lachnospiraceae bacterium]|nr:TrpR YerC/YecD [Lachnospiraceae bacterium]
MNKKPDKEAEAVFYDAVLSLQTREECEAFFEDVCTVNELIAISQRLAVARQLREGRTYLDIAESTGASTATISRVNRCLNYGKNGYNIVMDRLK